MRVTQPAPTDADRDPVIESLDGLLAVARDNIAAWVGVMDRVELIREARRQGIAWTVMQVDSPGPPIIDAVSRNQERLTVAAAHFRRALARALAEEGMSHAEIARLFGVSRQRVGILLRPEGATDVDDLAVDLTGVESDIPADSGSGRAQSTAYDEV